MSFEPPLDRIIHGRFLKRPPLTVPPATAGRAPGRPGFKPRSNCPRGHWSPAAFLLLVFSGCGYTIGNGFSPDIKTVSVPIFENDTYRRGLEYQLTESVQKEIQIRTPYRLARGSDADTRLTGRIVQVRKDVLGESENDDPRQLQFSILVRVTWENLRTGEVLAQQEVPVAPEAIPLIAQSGFAPELGQSQASATQIVVDQLAKNIVNMMEIPW